SCQNIVDAKELAMRNHTQLKKFFIGLLWPLTTLTALAQMTFAAHAQSFAYVTNASSSAVSVINTASNTVAATVGVGGRPVSVVITSDGTRAYVANSNSNSVSVINTATNTVIAPIPVGSYPQGLAIT